MKTRMNAVVCLAAMLFLLLVLCACGSTRTQQDNTMRIVCLRFPEYDWTRNMLGSNPAGIKLSLLIDSGTDVHSYQATVDDIAQITNCDLLIYTGGSSENWVSEAVSAGRDAALPVIRMLQHENMQLYENEEEAEEHTHEHSEIDEHFWLSIRNAETACEAISDALCRLDTENAELYRSNLNRYLEQLQSLDSSFVTTLGKAPLQSILVADRFPFRYLTADYDLTYCAAFSGCSSDTDASFETIIHLAEELNSKQLPAIIITESGDEKIAQAVIKNCSRSDISTLRLDSMQSVTRERIDSGETYISIMERNLDTLSQALTPAG